METALTFHNPLKRDRLGIPIAPKRVPWLGHLPQYLFSLPAFHHQLRSSGAPLFWVQPLPGVWSVECTDPADFSLLRSRSVSVSHYTQISPLLLGRSVLTRDGADHRSQRNAMNTPFTPRGLRAQGTSTVMRDTVSEQVARIAALGEFVALDETRTLALDIIFRILGISHDDLADWRVQYERVLLSTFPIQWQLPGMPAWFAARGRSWLSARIQQRIDALRQDEGQTGLLAEMVRGWDAQEQRPDDDGLLIDNVLLLALAGHETTASTMAWMACQLAADPDLFARATEEALGSEIPSSPAELTRFPLIEAIFRECLRLYPPVPAVTRLLVAPVELHGHTLPAGVQVSFPILMWQRDPARYPDPARFEPSRWLEAERKPGPIENIAFSFGPHFCLGYHVAWMESVQFGVGLLRALSQSGRALSLAGRFPKASYVGLCHPVKKQTRLSTRAL